MHFVGALIPVWCTFSHYVFVSAKNKQESDYVNTLNWDGGNLLAIISSVMPYGQTTIQTYEREEWVCCFLLTRDVEHRQDLWETFVFWIAQKQIML